MHIYHNICEGGVFLRQKAKTMVGLIALVVLMIGVWWSSEWIYGKQIRNDDIETSADVKKNTNKRVVIDAGHGGKDSGKIGVNKVLEKDINLEIAKKVQELLLKQNIKVIMTREKDCDLADSKIEDLRKRVDIINGEKPDLAVSIHQNSYTTENIHGAQVFYYSQSDQGEKLASILQTALQKVDPENKRKEKGNDSYFILKKTEVPVVIVECGFLSNPKETEKLISEEYQDLLAKAIFDGIMEFLSL